MTEKNEMSVTSLVGKAHEDKKKGGIQETGKLCIAKKKLTRLVMIHILSPGNISNAFSNLSQCALRIPKTIAPREELDLVTLLLLLPPELCFICASLCLNHSFILSHLFDFFLDDDDDDDVNGTGSCAAFVEV